MNISDAELGQRFQQRARRAMLAGLSALDQLPSPGKEQLAKLSVEQVHETLVVVVLRFVALALGRARGLFTEQAQLSGGRLFIAQNKLLDVQPVLGDGRLSWAFPAALAPAQSAFEAELDAGLLSEGIDFADCPAELLGNLYELLLGESVQRTPAGRLELEFDARRKKTGTFFTPRALTEVVVERALEPLARRIQASAHRSHDFVSEFRVCDPTVGGGAFLVQSARALLDLPGAPSSAERRRTIATRVLHGVDINPVAVAVAETAICLLLRDPQLSLADTGRNLRVGDALLGAPHGEGKGPLQLALIGAPDFDFVRQFPEVFERGGFDLVIGNPPWVAYAGRAAKPLSAERKAYFAAHYTTLKGYPTLHGLFVERALRLAPQGTVALVVPSPISDLQGYRAVRRAVRARHTPCEPMVEFGQDAFASVTQPCFALIAEASRGSRPPASDGELPFRLAERQRAGAIAAEVSVPSCLLELAQAPPFPRELFGEMGFQTTSGVTQNLLLRAASPDATHDYPLLQGRDVREFAQGEPRLFLWPDRAALAKYRCRLRDLGDYGRVSFVIRQTARYPIAARHYGLPFRNSLLAGFDVEGLPADLVVGLLNSSLYRALHLALRRDARQAAFPQVKIAHLRALPVPPADPVGRARIAALSGALTREGTDPVRVQELDSAVFELFSVDRQAAREVLDFFGSRVAPRHGE